VCAQASAAARKLLRTLAQFMKPEALEATRGALSFIVRIPVENNLREKPRCYAPSASAAKPIAPGIRASPEQMDASAGTDCERRTVTALFADIKGSMDLMENLDPKEARTNLVRHGIERIQGRARFLSPRQVEVGRVGGE
jgi:hypothetical protein